MLIFLMIITYFLNYRIHLKWLFSFTPCSWSWQENSHLPLYEGICIWTDLKKWSLVSGAEEYEVKSG